MKTTNAKADKIFNDHQAKCRLCLSDQLETSAHLLEECTALADQRAQYISDTKAKTPLNFRSILEDINNNSYFLDELQETFLFFTGEQLVPFISNQVDFTPESVILELEKTAKWISGPTTQQSADISSIK